MAVLLGLDHPPGTGGVPRWHDPRDDGQLPDVYVAMGQTAENVAQLCGVSRDSQDEFAVRSQHLAEKAIADGFWAREITPVIVPGGGVVTADDGPRPGVTLAAVRALARPAGRAGDHVRRWRPGHGDDRRAAELTGPPGRRGYGAGRAGRG